MRCRPPIFCRSFLVLLPVVPHSVPALATSIPCPESCTIRIVNMPGKGSLLPWVLLGRRAEAVTIVKWTRSLLALALLAMALRSVAAAGETAAVSATLAGDCRTVTVKAPGVIVCQGGFAASIKVGNQPRELSAAGGRAAGPAQKLTEQTPYGSAAVNLPGINGVVCVSCLLENLPQALVVMPSRASSTRCSSRCRPVPAAICTNPCSPMK